MLYFSFSSKQKMMPFYLGDFKAAGYEKFLLTVRWGPNQKNRIYNGNHGGIPMPGQFGNGLFALSDRVIVWFFNHIFHLSEARAGTHNTVKPLPRPF